MKVGVIGCGAAGMMAAITAAYNGHKVTILEHGIKPGKKLLATGNGKCNFTHTDITSEFYNESGRDLFNNVYSKFTYENTVSFFDEIGMMNVCKNGYYYPRSEQATTVVNTLINEINRLKINTVFECNIGSIIKKNVFEIKTDKGNFDFDKVIIATGSKASPKTGSDGSGYKLAESFGHKIVKPLPALCALECKGFDFKAVAGVRCKGRVTLLVDSRKTINDIGELQLTDYGLSGIPVFQISSKAVRHLDSGSKVQVIVDFMPEEDNLDVIVNTIIDRAASGRFSRVSDMLSGMFNDKLARTIVKQSGLKDEIRGNAISKEDARSIAKIIKELKVTVTGYKGFDNCQVCSGGISCGELKTTLESKMCEGLYFAGEIIDIDGICGGYNLQWAWSSGHVAGLLQV